MKELGSSNGMPERKNVQGRCAKEARKTTGDAKTEQTPRESSDVRRKTVHFTANGVFHSSEEKSAFEKGPSDQDAMTEQPSPEYGSILQQMARYAKKALKLQKARFFILQQQQL